MDLSPDEQNLALSQGLLGLGAGLLSGSFGHYGAFAPSLAAGAQGFQTGYGNSLKYSLESQQLKMLKQNYDRQNMMMDYGMKFLQNDPNFGGGQVGPALSSSPYVNAPPPPPMIPGTSTSPYVLAPPALSSGPTPALSQSVAPQSASPQPVGNDNPNAGYGKFAFITSLLKGDPSGMAASAKLINPDPRDMREGGVERRLVNGRYVTTYIAPKDNMEYTQQPDGSFTAAPIPGSVEALARQAKMLEDAKLAAQDPHTMIEVPIPGGKTKLMTRADYLASQKPASGPITQPAQSTAPSVTAPTSYNGGGLGVSQGTESKEYSTKLAAARETYTNSALAAQEALPSIQLMKGALINGLKTNNLAEYTTGFTGWMKSFGIDPTEYGLNDPTNVQEFSKGATKLVADMTRALGGREPFQAMQFVQKGNPGLGNTVDANVKLVALAEGTKLWEIQRDQAAQAWAASHGGTTDGFIQNFQMRNPVQTYWQRSYEELKKQVPENPVLVKPMRQTAGTGSSLDFSTDTSSSHFKQRPDGSLQYVPGAR